MCRARKPAHALLRLSRDPATGGVRFGPGDGRGAWVCPQATCLRSLERKPGRLGQALRAPDVTTKLLIDAARANALSRLRQALGQAQKAGLVSSGQGALERTDRVVAAIVARDAGEHIRQRLPTLDPAVVVWFGPACGSLGQWVGSGPRAIVLIGDGKPGLSVAAVLRILQDLG